MGLRQPVVEPNKYIFSTPIVLNKSLFQLGLQLSWLFSYRLIACQVSNCIITVANQQLQQVFVMLQQQTYSRTFINQQLGSMKKWTPICGFLPMIAPMTRFLRSWRMSTWLSIPWCIFPITPRILFSFYSNNQEDEGQGVIDHNHGVHDILLHMKVISHQNPSKTSLYFKVCCGQMKLFAIPVLWR